ncbi:MAG: radical SAM protein, partial [Oscillospiraceae bacterium]|nr:radical SAM protein [Oscillospiraceae bacterium]
RGLSDFELWRTGAEELKEGEGLSCPQNCGICSEHIQGSCCVLLEVTRRCNLSCSFCFAGGEMAEPSLEELKMAVDTIVGRGKPLIQLSGGEPSLRSDLPELIRYIRSKGVGYVQLNGNGLRLAGDEEYVKSLAEAGLSFVFLQFDGVSDDIYEKLRGKPLLEIKKKAIELCGKYGLGVTLVPTIVKGVNEHQVGDIIRFAAALSPVVRGVHFQPVSYFGRYPEEPDDRERYTLDELIYALGVQAGIKEENIAPSRCDHPSCGAHASFVVMKNGSLMPLTFRRKTQKMSSAIQNREYIGSRWARDTEKEQSRWGDDLSDMDAFVERVKSHGFTVTAMAFQDAMNIDIERLRRCSLHVYSDGKLKPFCAAYLTGIGE